MRYRLLCLISLILFIATGVSAQAADEWYLAWTLDGQLLSFTAEGAPQTLIDSGMNGDMWAWRMDDGSVIALLGTEDSDGRGLFHVTREAAQPVLDSDGQPLLLEGDAWRFIAEGKYAVLVDGAKIPSGAAVLVNVETNTATQFEQQVSFFIENTAVFSEDGAYFRYLGRETPDSETWTLRELKLETGAERVFYTIENDGFPFANTDQYGEQWIYRLKKSTFLISRSGETQTISFTEMKDAIAIRYVVDHLLSFPVDCGEDCELTWKPLPDGEPLIFPMPPTDTIQVPNPLAQIGDQLLAMIDGETLWLLSTDGSGTKLGYWSPQTLVTPMGKLLSPDQRWILALTLPEDGLGQGYHVIDLQTLNPVLSSDLEREYHIVQITYSAGGFIVAEDSQHFQFFRSSDQQIFDLGEPGGLFWNVQADGTLLYAQFRAAGEHARGIYRYNADTQEYTSLVEGGVPLFIEEGS